MLRNRTRILITKIGLDGHDVGAKVLAFAAREAGHEAIYLGVRQTPETVARTAVEANVDLVAVSILSGAHRQLLPALVRALEEKGADIPVVAGGLIPAADVQFLRDAGVASIVAPGTTLPNAMSTIANILNEQSKSSSTEKVDKT